MSQDDKQFEQALEKIIEARFTNSKSLDLSGLKLRKVPSSISKLSNLESLDLSNNKIEALPDELYELTNLRTLHLSQNKLINISWKIENLKKLKFFRAESNDLISIPDSFGRLVQLEGVFLRNNKLVQLPQEICNLKGLRKLDVSKNRISNLPVDLLQLTSLETLLLHENELSIPTELLGSYSMGNVDAQKIMRFLDESNEGQKHQLNETKMLIVGQGAVGKTSIVRQLMGERHDPNSKKTDGINIRPLRVALENRTIQLNMWDFGGQEVMHATHQFFLTQRSIYLLILDARMDRDANKPDYWLGLIEQYGGNDAPIIIVVNKIDDNPILNLNEAALKRNFNILNIIRTSCLTGEGITELKSTIMDTLGNLPHVSDILPRSWFLVKSSLENEKHRSDVIPYSFFAEVCESQQIEITSRHHLLGLLHDLGTLLDFYDPKAGEVREETNIVNPEWVTDGVYSIINSKSVFSEKGVLIKSQLKDILDKRRYPTLATRESILRIMERFELAFPFDSGKKYLIPDLLPETEPPISGFAETLKFEYRYTNFIPPSVLSRFIVRQHDKIKNRANELWRDGVVIYFEKMRALVRAEAPSRKLTIEIEGSPKRRLEFLAIIRDTFDAIHESFAKLKVRAMVPIPGESDAAVSYKALLAAVHNRELRVYVEDLDDYVLARPLLMGVDKPKSNRELREWLLDRLSLKEIQAALFDMKIDFEKISGENKSEYAINTLKFLEQRGQVDDFVFEIERQRPDLRDN